MKSVRVKAIDIQILKQFGGVTVPYEENEFRTFEKKPFKLFERVELTDGRTSNKTEVSSIDDSGGYTFVYFKLIEPIAC